MTYIRGENIRVSVEVYDPAGTLVDPTGLTFRWRVASTNPGVITTYTLGTDAELVQDSVGQYHVDISTTSVRGNAPRDHPEARVAYRWEGTGINAFAKESEFVVATGAF